MKKLFAASAMLFLAACSTAPKPPTVNGYHKQPINAQQQKAFADQIAKPATPATTTNESTASNAQQLLESSLKNAKRVEIEIFY